MLTSSKIFLFIAFFVLSFSTNTYANEEHNFRLKFGGWSKHTREQAYETFKPNESHRGIGLQYWYSPNWFDTDWQVGGEFFYMTDSNYQPARMYSLAGRYPFDLNTDILTQVSVETGLTYHDRSQLWRRITLQPAPYSDRGYLEEYSYDINRDKFFTPMAVLTFTFFDCFDVDVTYLPKTNMNVNSVFFMRFGMKI